MIILSKNKQTLKINEFKFKCCIGKNGTSSKKREGDKKTPKGIFSIGNLYYRADRMNKPFTKLKKIIIKKNMGWCDDVNIPKYYNKLIKIDKKIRCERLYRQDYKYDLLILIKYNFKKPTIPNGSCIFLHLTNNYKPTAGCVGLKEKDFLILLRLITTNTKILIN